MSRYLRLRATWLRWCCLTASAFLVLALVGCSTPEPPPEPVTLRFTIPMDSPRAEVEYYRTLLQTFTESYPHITVEVNQGEVVSTNSQRDIVMGWGARLIEAQMSGDLVDLTPYIEMDAEAFDRSDFYPGILDTFTFDDKVWSIPAGLDPLLVYYNKDMFDAQGVPYPEAGWTWDDFLSAATALSDSENGVFGYGPHYQQAGQFDDTIIFMFQHGGTLFADMQDPNNPVRTFADPLTVEALEWYVDLVREYHVAPTYQEATRYYTSGNPYEGMEAGRLGMYFGALNARVFAENDWWNVNWAMAPVPSGSQSAVTQVWIRGYAISSQSQYPDECWQVISFLDRQVSYLQMPARSSVAASQEYVEFVGEDVAAVTREAMASGGLPSPILWISTYADSMELFREAVYSALSGEMMPQEAMEWAQSASEP